MRHGTTFAATPLSRLGIAAGIYKCAPIYVERRKILTGRFPSKAEYLPDDEGGFVGKGGRFIALPSP